MHYISPCIVNFLYNRRKPLHGVGLLCYEVSLLRTHFAIYGVSLLSVKIRSRVYVRSFAIMKQLYVTSACKYGDH